MYKNNLTEKLKEALAAVVPIMLIVLILSLLLVPVPSGILLSFILGSVMLIAGMMLFSLGAELSMQPMGEKTGSKITGSKKLWLVLLLSFALGFMITISEPDLQVLAGQVQSIPNSILIVSVAAGVGFFLVAAILRMLFGIPLRIMLLVSYAIIFVLSLFAPRDFLAVAFDSGGVTTGPMTVPFIMAFGIGICAVRSDKHAGVDSFGLVALCSAGPIIAVLTLALIYNPADASYSSAFLPDVSNSVDMGRMFLQAAPSYMKEIAVSLLPIALFFYVFQLISLKLEKRTVKKISVGIVYTYIGLVVFLTGANVGFMPAGSYLGRSLAEMEYSWCIIPVGMLIGYFIVKAEPAVYVLQRQVEELTDGDISGRSLRISLSAGVAVSVGLAMLRVLTGISVMWFIVPGYSAALVMSFFVPKLFTAIAFDSGGVASGPMTATFLLPFAVGACVSGGGNVVTDAFGVVAMVAMTPLLSIQILGIVYALKSKKIPSAANETASDGSDDFAVIEL